MTLFEHVDRQSGGKMERYFTSVCFNRAGQTSPHREVSVTQVVQSKTGIAGAKAEAAALCLSEYGNGIKINSIGASLL